MKRILLLLVLCLNISMVLGQEYKNWEKGREQIIISSPKWMTKYSHLVSAKK